MDQVVLWPRWCALIDPVYPKNEGSGRPEAGLEEDAAHLLLAAVVQLV